MHFFTYLTFRVRYTSFVKIYSVIRCSKSLNGKLCLDIKLLNFKMANFYVYNIHNYTSVLSHTGVASMHSYICFIGITEFMCIVYVGNSK